MSYLSVRIDGWAAGAGRACSPPALHFDLWGPSVCVGSAATDDEHTRLPLCFDLWALSPAFPGWCVDRAGRVVYSPGGYFDGLFGVL